MPRGYPKNGKRKSRFAKLNAENAELRLSLESVERDRRAVVDSIWPYLKSYISKMIDESLDNARITHE